MKNWKQKMVIGIFAIITFVFTVIACDNGGDGGTPVHVHKWGDWTITPATCSAEGVKTRVCDFDASHTDSRVIPIDPNAHHFNEDESVETPATCEEDGKEEGICTICNKQAVNVLPALGHDYNWVPTTASTCTTAGVETGTCTRDGTTTPPRPIAIDPNAHLWNNNWVLTTPPTITQEGVETDTCAHDASHERFRSIDTVTITSVADLDTYLSGLSTNTKETAYKIALNVSDISTLKTTLNNATDKYVYLDLSGSTITTIPASAFGSVSACTTLVGITIPSGVISIEFAAFNGCDNLTSVTIPDGVTSIGMTAFADCTSLAGVIIPNSVTNIEGSAFNNCDSLTSVIIPNSVTSIGSSAFNGCDNLTSLTIPGGVTSIENFAFNRCTNLASVTFQGTILSSGFTSNAFGSNGANVSNSDLYNKFYATDTTNGTPGTYNRTGGDGTAGDPYIWTKQ